MLYIHDTLELFGALLLQLHDLWRDRISVQLPRSVIRHLGDARRRLFTETNDIIRNAARIATGRDLTPRLLLDACQLGLGRVFER